MGLGNPFKSIEKKIKQGIESLGNKVKQGVESVGNKIKREVESTGKKAVGEVEKGAKRAVGEVEKGGKTFVAEIEKGGKKAIGEIDKAGQKAIKEIEKGVNTAFQAMLREIQKGALNKAVDIIQVAAPDAVELKMGPIGLPIEDIKERIDTLQRWAKKPPSKNSDIKKMILELAPTSVSVELSASVAFLVVQSDSLEFGVTMSWQTEMFLEKFEDIFKHL